MKTLIVTVGIPRCGKSTWAKSTGLPTVNPDSIRKALHGEAFISSAEPMVWCLAKYMVRALFEAGHEVVILDATNVSPRRRAEWNSKDWATRYKIFDTPKDVCIQRARDNGQEYLVPVIERMSKELEWPKENILDETQKGI